MSLKGVGISLWDDISYIIFIPSPCKKLSGAKSENFVASHLLKAVHRWTDKGKSVSKNLFHFQKQIHALHAFQASFSTKQPIIVPVKTLLSQLV